MKLFNDHAVETAQENTLKLLQKLASLKPEQDTLTREEIGELMYYIEDYRMELQSLAYNRKRKAYERERKERMSHDN